MSSSPPLDQSLWLEVQTCPSVTPSERISEPPPPLKNPDSPAIREKSFLPLQPNYILLSTATMAWVELVRNPDILKNSLWKLYYVGVFTSTNIEKSFICYEKVMFFFRVAFFFFSKWFSKGKFSCICSTHLLRAAMATTSPLRTPSSDSPRARLKTPETNCWPVFARFPEIVTGMSRRRLEIRLKHWQMWPSLIAIRFEPEEHKYLSLSLLLFFSFRLMVGSWSTLRYL